MFTNNNVGKITLVTGPMFSGKTLELLRLIDQLEYSKKEYVVFKSSIDVSEEDFSIKSRWEKSKKSLKIDSILDIKKYIEKNPNTYAVVIDEVQFLDKEIVRYLDRLAFKGFHIILGGLDRDYTGKPFETTSLLSGIADEVKKLNSICSICGKEAYLSQKIFNSKPVVVNGKKIELKSDASYIPVCRQHFAFEDKND